MCSANPALVLADDGNRDDFRRSLAERLESGPLKDILTLQLRTATLAHPVLLPEARKQPFQTIELELLAQNAIDQLREIIAELAGGPPPEVPLLAQLTALCDQLRVGSGIDCRLLVEPAHVHFDTAVDDVLYRAVRELLTNVRQHAYAANVKIASAERRDVIAITVSDDGIGLPPEARHRNPTIDGGFGLWSVEQRLREFGGRLEIDTDAGTRITILLPRHLLALD